MSRYGRRIPFIRRAALAAAIGLCALPAAGLAAARAARPAPLPPLAERVRQDSLQFAAAVTAQKFGDLLPLLARDVKDARAASNRVALGRLLRFQGVAYAMSGDGLRAVPALDEGLALSAALGDTAQWLLVLRWRTYAAGMLGRMDEQRDLARRLVALADSSRDLRYVAVGHNFLGWNERGRGNLAKARFHLERAVASHRALRNELDEAIALGTYGATLLDLDDDAEARRCFDRQLEIARRLKQPWLEAQALNDLGILERREGDPARGAEDIRAAWEIRRTRGETPDLATSLLNLASVELELGHGQKVAELANDGLALCRRRGFTLTRANFHGVLALLAESEGRPGEAASHWDHIMAMGDSAEPRTRVLAIMGVARAKRAAGRPDEDLALFERAVRDYAPGLPRREAQQLVTGLATRYSAAGRDEEALAAARRAVSLGAASPGSLWGIRAWRTAAISERRLGRMAEAKAAFDSSCAAWEIFRGRPSDPEWRELRSDSFQLMTDYADFLLTWPPAATDSARFESAYQRVQDFRARTLLERMAGPRGAASATAAARRPGLASRIQRGMLGPHDLLLEWMPGLDRTLLFAISPGARRVFRLPAGAALEARIRTARELFAAAPRAPSDRAAADAVSRELARLVFGDALPLVAKARALVLVPDGPLNLVPFSALVVGSEPLAATRAVTLTPSVAVLEQARRPSASPQPGRLVLVVGTAAGGLRLEGAEREIAWLAGAFEGVKRADAATAAGDAAALLSGYDALHFAGHTSVDDQYPWRSGIEIGSATPAAATRGAPEAAPEATLRAAAISALPLRARLVVLSSCETAAGRIFGGEGVSGLSSAFLAAGARTVVASLWRVDDRATGALMREFYRGLASGRTAAEALRAAQDRLRRSRETSHPYYWAGFVLLGDGGTTLPLKSAPFWRRGANAGGL